VNEKRLDFHKGDKLEAGTKILHRFWPEGWCEGTVLGRSGKRGHNYRVLYSDGETIDHALREENYAWGEQPPHRYGIWCCLRSRAGVPVV